jgi:hypothetical protein
MSAGGILPLRSKVSYLKARPLGSARGSRLRLPYGSQLLAAVALALGAASAGPLAWSWMLLAGWAALTLYWQGRHASASRRPAAACARWPSSEGVA